MLYIYIYIYIYIYTYICILNLLVMILNESSYNFCFLIQNPLHIFRKSIDFDLLLYNVLNQLECRILGLWSKFFFFMWLDTVRANQLIKFFCLAFVRHSQLWLDQSRFQDSWNYNNLRKVWIIIFYIWILIKRITNRSSFFKAI